MYKKILVMGIVSCCFIVLAGCVVRTYPVVKERVDQDLSGGNRGYIMGKPGVSKESRKTTRKVQVVEVELHPVKIEQTPPSLPVSELEPAYPVYVPPSREVPPVVISSIEPIGAPPTKSRVVVMKKYTVGKGDTLQRISKKFYGTTKRWKEIFEVNQEILKSPNNIYPGQMIEIPVEELSGEK